MSYEDRVRSLHRAAVTGSRQATEAAVAGIAERTAVWLWSRRNADGPGFGLCPSAYAPIELNATTGGVELWVMLGLPLSGVERAAWTAHLRSYQSPRTGLVVDPTWRDRQIEANEVQLTDGDSFFTMTAAAALEALGATFERPITYLARLSEEEMRANAAFVDIAHRPGGVGDYGRLLWHDMRLGAPGAEARWNWFSAMLAERQDVTGLWPDGGVSQPLTPWINRAFHVLRSSWNLSGEPIHHADRMIDACLSAAGDPEFYGWDTGYACNDLDLVHVAYSAACWTRHRRDELQAFARDFLAHLLAVERPDGGFSFYHEEAMDVHGGLRMSPSRAEADTWGTLMYMGAIRMAVALGWPGAHVPWGFSRVHAVPERGLA